MGIQIKLQFVDVDIDSIYRYREVLNWILHKQGCEEVKWITGDFVNTKADRGDICRMHSRGGN